MSNTHIYLHVVFAVKRRQPVLLDNKRSLLLRHIEDQAAARHIELKAINGYEDHLHMLIRIRETQSIASVMQLIKGESARWANLQELFQQKLTWATGYYARSIDPRNVRQVMGYIAGQPAKHGQALEWLQGYLQSIQLQSL